MIRGPFYSYDYEMNRGEMNLVLTTWDVLRETPKGVWLQERPKRNKWGNLYQMTKPDIWINPKTRKAKAYSTKKEALASFEARKRKWKRYLERYLKMANAMLELSQEERDSNYVQPPQSRRVYFPKLFGDYDLEC